MSIGITQQLNLVNPASDIDAFYGPYNSVADAKTLIPSALLTSNTIGRKIGIKSSDGTVIDYTWLKLANNTFDFVSDYNTLNSRITTEIGTITTSVTSAITTANSASVQASTANSLATAANTAVVNLADTTKATTLMKDWALNEKLKIQADYNYISSQYTITPSTLYTAYATAYTNYLTILDTIINAVKDSTISTTLTSLRVTYYSTYSTVLVNLKGRIDSAIDTQKTRIDTIYEGGDIATDIFDYTNEYDTTKPISGLDAATNSYDLQSSDAKGAILVDSIGINDKSGVVEAGLNGRNEDLLLWAGASYKLASSGAYKEYYKTNHSGDQIPLVVKHNGEGKIGPMQFNVVSSVDNAIVNGTVKIGDLNINTKDDPYFISNLKYTGDAKSYYTSDPEGDIPSRSSVLIKHDGTGNFGCLSVDKNLNESIYSSAQSNVLASQIINRTQIHSNDGSITLSKLYTEASNPSYKDKIVITPQALFKNNVLQSVLISNTDTTVDCTENWVITDNVATLNCTPSLIEISNYNNLRVSIPKLLITSTEYFPSQSEIDTYNYKVTKTLLCRVTYFKNSTTQLEETPEDFVVYTSGKDFEYNLQIPATTIGINPKYRDCLVKLELVAYWTKDKITYKFENTTTPALTKQGINTIAPVTSTAKILLLYNARTGIANNSMIIIGADGILTGSSETQYTFIRNDGAVIMLGYPTSSTISNYPVGTVYMDSDSKCLKIKLE